MQYGISGGPLPAGLPYVGPITQACEPSNFSPVLAYAVACRESIIGELNGKWNACTVCSDDGGHGLFQLTSSWPENWEDPLANAQYAVKNFLRPALDWWRLNAPQIEGDDLVRCIAASFNAGIGGAWSGHLNGNVDLYTTDNYGAGVLQIYKNLIATGKP